MISKLNYLEFKNRLKANTKNGNPKSFGTPFSILSIFSKSRKKYIGEINSVSFNLTENTTLLPIPYIIDGTYKSKSKSTTEISFKIKIIWFGYLWIRILPVLALGLINSLLLMQGNNIKTEIFVIVNLFLLLMFLPVLIVSRKKKKMIGDFCKLFEI
ncbi:hypothetical protein [Labilibaculum euxinus]|uniref:Uncharacterized protein n=1 Tax=Labilibaculum euxinus TaxID=2686357 RepID=A0A7M4D6F0_9BACT|nr:hypothetical protein [Labilibaculum euxinus]MUP38229.1 hypothetical protein [Labilibaculum euxinus]MVB07434.1 hypothetical protein [Labilibaculum euxinus]